MTADPPQQLNRSEHYKLVISVRDAMDRMRGDDQSLLLVHFGFSALGFNFEGPSLSEALIDGRQEDLIALAQHLDIEVPLPPTAPGIPTAYAVDIYSQLVAAETAFREIVRTTIGPGWIDDFDADRVKALEAKRTEEDKRRDGVSVSQDLLDYTEAYHLKSLVLKHWDKTGPVLADKKRAEVYLDAMLDVRNTIAHARPVVPHERHLLAGIAGQIQNLISVYRSSSETADAYYASINYVRDPFGVEGRRDGVGSRDARKRLKIGQAIVFDFSATDPHDREIQWTFSVFNKAQSKLTELGIALGPNATFQWTVGEQEVGEEIDVWVSIANESPYQRKGEYDDRVCFGYSVSPPVPPRSR